MHHIFTSVWALTTKLNLSPLSASISRIKDKQAHSLTNMQIVSIPGWQIPTQSPSSLPCQKWTPYYVRVVFSRPIHVPRVEIGALGANHSFFKASLAATKCTAFLGNPTHLPLHVPPFLSTQNLHAGKDYLFCSVQHDVTKKCTQGLLS